MCRLRFSYEGTLWYRETPGRKHCWTPETRCHCLWEHCQISWKSTDQSHSPKKNRAAEFELILDSKLTHFESRVSKAVDRKVDGGNQRSHLKRYKFNLCRNRQKRQQETNTNKSKEKVQFCKLDQQTKKVFRSQISLSTVLQMGRTKTFEESW